MRTIIAGSRDFPGDMWSLGRVIDKIRLRTPILCILSGMARGPDFWGKSYGESRDIPVEQYAADWNRLGKSAGFKRNIQMAEKADALIAFWDGKSKGTKHMIDIALEYGLWVKIIRPK